MAYVYIIACEDESLYTGIAKDLGHRMQEHYYKKKNCAKYTRVHGIKSIEAVWETTSLSDAAKLEYKIKQLDRERKKELIQHPEQITSYLAEDRKECYHPLSGISLEDYIKK